MRFGAVDAQRAAMLIFLNRAPVAQLDRASGYEPEGREFESPRARHSLNLNDLIKVNVTGTVWRGTRRSGNSSPQGESRISLESSTYSHS
jgi:hypothetical protein